MIGMVVVTTSWTIGFFSVYLWYSYYPPLSSKSQSSTSNINNSNNKILPSSSSITDNNNHNNNNYDSPLLIFTCHRDNYLKETLETVLTYIPHYCKFGCPVIVSEDGQHDNIRNVITDYQSKFHQIGIPLVHLIHTQNLRRGVSPATSAYVALAQHYKWALTQVFDGTYGSKAVTSKSSVPIPSNFPSPKRVMILEEDIRIAPDFFSYMEATSTLLDNDPTLLAVSAFNDNGHEGIVDAKRLLRSDFFPGLGWMLTYTLWKTELHNKWPDGYWDDWLRDPVQRKDRQIIRPEIST
jgi:alpha-1,3-mannosyl-glycoprotein beta-1,2-N-acetylglucosaminyltransferase